MVNDEEFLNQFLQKFDPKRRKQQEERQKQKEDSRKFQSLREENLPAAVLKFNRFVHCSVCALSLAFLSTAAFVLYVALPCCSRRGLP